MAHRRRRTPTRGFTLLELMVVVALIGILAFTAIPTMRQARIDRRVYEDAARIVDLVRDARTRAMGRGAAVMVSFSTATGDPGLIQSFESVSPNPVAASAGAPRVPIGTCDAPSNWTNSNASANATNAIRTIAFGDGHGTSYEETNGISATLSEGATVYVCFTPMGRAYLATGTAVFTLPMTKAITVEVARRDGGSVIGLRRRVVIPPSGNARIVSVAP